MAFLGYCLNVTLRMKLQKSAPGLTPGQVLQSLSAIQMLEVQIPTTDGRTLVLPRHTEPQTQQKLILEKLGCKQTSVRRHSRSALCCAVSDAFFRFGLARRALLARIPPMIDKIFKAYDVRAVYPNPLNEENAWKVGHATAQFLSAAAIRWRRG